MFTQWLVADRNSNCLVPHNMNPQPPAPTTPNIHPSLLPTTVFLWSCSLFSLSCSLNWHLLVEGVGCFVRDLDCSAEKKPRPEINIYLSPVMLGWGFAAILFLGFLNQLSGWNAHWACFVAVPAVLRPWSMFSCGSPFVPPAQSKQVEGCKLFEPKTVVLLPARAPLPPYPPTPLSAKRGSLPHWPTAKAIFITFWKGQLET